MASTETIRRRATAPTPTREASKDEDDSTLYEPPEGVPAGTIFFRYNKFQHNAKISLFMVPCAILLAMFGGQTTIGVIVAGILLIYLLDFYGWKESTFVAVWVTVSSVVVTLITSSLHLFSVSMFNIALVYNMLIFCSGVGIWATIQFSFLQQQHPRMILIFERLLFAIMPSSPPVIMTWAAVATYGMESAPFFLLVFLGIGYYLFVLPTRSSFRVLGKGRSKSLLPEMDELDELVMGRFESAVHTVSFIMLPVFFKYAIHHTHLISSKDDVADLLLLSSLPLLVIASLSTRGSLWWLGFSSSYISGIRKFTTTLTVLVIVGSLEVRVIFHSLAQYIKVSPPWDMVAVTSGTYLFALIVLAHYGGFLESSGMTFILTLVGGAVIACFCIALGVPFYMTPFGCAGAFFCARFYYYKRLQDYCSFVGTAALVIFWFIIRTFMFLDFEFDPLPMSLKHVCLVLMAVVLTSLLIPGLVSVNKVGWINGAVLCLHAAGINIMELQLHCQFEGIYPIYMVLFTSTVGLYLANYLFCEGKITTWTAWLMGALYAGKLGLVFHPTPFTLPASIILVLAISPIYVGMSILRPKSGQEKKLSKNAGMGLLLGVGAALFVTRHSVVTTVVKMTIHQSPPESFLLGIICIIWTITCSGLFAYHFPQSSKLRRTFAVVLCVGATLMFIQPNMEFLRKYSPIRTFPNEMRSEKTWPSWCLFGSVVSGLFLVGNSKSNQVSWGAQMLLSATGGFLAGLYFDGTFLPYSASLYSISGLACCLAAQFVAFVPTVKVNGSLYVQIVFTLFIGLLPVALMLQPALLRSVPAHERAEAIQDHRVGLLGLYVVLSVVMAMTVKLQLSEPEEASISRPRTDTVRSRSVVASSGRGAWDWLPAAGNLATVVAYGLALTVSQWYMKASEEVVVGVAPLLLLLSQDSGLFSSLTDRQRYFPLVAASVACLAGSAVFRLVLREQLERHHWLPRSHTPFPEAASVVAVAKNLGLLAVTLPGHAMFGRFLWSFKQTRDLYWVLLLPLNVLPIVLADLASIRLLAVLAIAAGSLQLLLSSRIRRFGLQFV